MIMEMEIEVKNPPIPETMQEHFRISAVAYDEGRRGMVRVMREYREQFEGEFNFSVMQMYKDFSDLTRIETDAHPRISPRTLRHYAEAVEGLDGDLYRLFEEQIISFDHCEADKKLTAENGLERGYCLEWAVAPYIETGRRPHSTPKMIAHFAQDNNLDMDTIYTNKLRSRVLKLADTPLPSNWAREVREGVIFHVTALRELLDKCQEGDK